MTPLSEERALDLRRRAIAAVSAVFEELQLATHGDMKASVAIASGSDDTRSFSPRDVSFISEAIKDQQITVVDVIKALAKRGFREEAENLLNVVKLRLSGDYLQTSAMIRNGRVVSAVNDPNDYLGPGTGYRVSPERREELNAIRDVLDQKEVLRSEALHERDEAQRIRYKTLGPHRSLRTRPMSSSASVLPSASSCSRPQPVIACLMCCAPSPRPSRGAV